MSLLEVTFPTFIRAVLTSEDMDDTKKILFMMIFKMYMKEYKHKVTIVLQDFNAKLGDEDAIQCTALFICSFTWCSQPKLYEIKTTVVDNHLIFKTDFKNLHTV